MKTTKKSLHFYCRIKLNLKDKFEFVPLGFTCSSGLGAFIKSGSLMKPYSWQKSDQKINLSLSSVRIGGKFCTNFLLKEKF